MDKHACVQTQHKKLLKADSINRYNVIIMLIIEKKFMVCMAHHVMHLSVKVRIP